jgi:hypothetical protein
MKQLKLSLIALLAVFTALAASSANAAKAVQIDIGGIGPPVDGAAMATIKQVIGFAVARGVVGKYIDLNDGVRLPIEGGFSACVQASPRTNGFETFVQQLRSIKPNPATTAYSVKSTTSCPPVVFCPQDAKMCPDGSFVGRVAPSCAFAPCPGKK